MSQLVTATIRQRCRFCPDDVSVGERVIYFDGLGVAHLECAIQEGAAPMVDSQPRADLLSAIARTVAHEVRYELMLAGLEIVPLAWTEEDRTGMARRLRATADKLDPIEPEADE